jgi:hypothetical protein
VIAHFATCIVLRGAAFRIHHMWTKLGRYRIAPRVL